MNYRDSILACIRGEADETGDREYRFSKARHAIVNDGCFIVNKREIHMQV